MKKKSQFFFINIKKENCFFYINFYFIEKLFLKKRVLINFYDLLFSVKLVSSFFFSILMKTNWNRFSIKSNRTPRKETSPTPPTSESDQIGLWKSPIVSAASYFQNPKNKQRSPHFLSIPLRSIHTIPDFFFLFFSQTAPNPQQQKNTQSNSIFPSSIKKENNQQLYSSLT